MGKQDDARRAWKQKKPLTERQSRFCEEYMIDGNGKQSAIRAGYTGNDRTLEVAASRLLRNDKVRARIDQLRKKRSKRVEANADRVIEEVARIALANVTDLVQVVETDEVRQLRARITAIESKLIELEASHMNAPTDEHADKIQSKIDFLEGELDQIRYNLATSEAVSIRVKPTDELTEQQKAAVESISVDKYGNVKVTMHSKLAALDKLMRHHGLLTEKFEVEDVNETRRQEAAERVRAKMQAMGVSFDSNAAASDVDGNAAAADGQEAASE